MIHTLRRQSVIDRWFTVYFNLRSGRIVASQVLVFQVRTPVSPLQSITIVERSLVEVVVIHRSVQAPSYFYIPEQWGLNHLHLHTKDMRSNRS